MQQKQSPIQKYYLFKSFVIMFMIQAIIVLFLPMGLAAPIWYQILLVNLVVGLVLGWFLYKQWYHIEFSCGDTGFSLRKGKAPAIVHMWKEFSRVSLARNEYGEYKIRLYGTGDPFEIPVSKLKLDPFQFRLDVMKLVAMSQVA